jgi:hypothetical protein
MIFYTFLLILSSFILFLISLKSFKEVSSFIYIFLLFTLLYTLLPMLFIQYQDYINVNFTLPLLDKEHIIYVVKHQIIIYFLLSVLLYNKNFKYLLKVADKNYTSSFGKDIFYIYIILYLPSFIMVYLFPWFQYGDTVTFGNSISSYIVTINLILFASLSIQYSNNKLSKNRYLFILLLILILFILFTARTPLFILIFMLIWTFNIKVNNIFKYIPQLLFIIVLFIFITLNRNDIEMNLTTISYPFFVEALYGSYGALQAQEINSIPIYSFLYPIIDSIMYLIPSIFFDLFDTNKLYSMNEASLVTNAYTNGTLEHKFQPMGGHFYLGEYILVFGLFTPIAFVVFIFLYFKLLEKFNNEIGLLMLSGSFLIIKSPISSIFKYYISIFILYYLFNFFLHIIFKVKVKKL